MDSSRETFGNKRKTETTTTISFRATTEEVTTIDAAANADARQRAPWIKDAVLEAARHRPRRNMVEPIPTSSESAVKAKP